MMLHAWKIEFDFDKLHQTSAPSWSDQSLVWPAYMKRWAAHLNTERVVDEVKIDTENPFEHVVTEEPSDEVLEEELMRRRMKRFDWDMSTRDERRAARLAMMSEE
jgi:hypothetical protein